MEQIHSMDLSLRRFEFKDCVCPMTFLCDLEHQFGGYFDENDNNQIFEWMQIVCTMN